MEAAHLEEDRRVAGLLRAVADRREGLARLGGQVNTLRSRAAAADDEIGRLAASRAEAADRAAKAQHDFTALETRIAGLDSGEQGLDAEHEGAVALVADIDERIAKQRIALQAAERERAALEARAEALDVGLRRKDGAAALLAASERVSGLLGSVAALVSVRPGHEAAVAAALGTAADAVAVVDLQAAVGAIQHLKDADLGRAGLVLGGADARRGRLARAAGRGRLRRRRGRCAGVTAACAATPARQDGRRTRPRGCHRAGGGAPRCRGGHQGR